MGIIKKIWIIQSLWAESIPIPKAFLKALIHKDDKLEGNKGAMLKYINLLLVK